MAVRRVVFFFVACAAVALLTACGGPQPQTLAASAPPSMASTTAAPSNTIVLPAPPQPSTVTQYATPYPYYTSTYAPPSPSSSSDEDFLARLKARDIVTPGDPTEIAGGQAVCTHIAQGSNVHAEANALMDAPYNYSAALAGYFAGEAVKVYCPGSSDTTTSTPTDTTTSTSTPGSSGTGVSYPNCAAVKAAGAAPLHRGQPGYSAKLDRDGDGIACER